MCSPLHQPSGAAQPPGSPEWGGGGGGGKRKGEGVGDICHYTVPPPVYIAQLTGTHVLRMHAIINFPQSTA